MKKLISFSLLFLLLTLHFGRVLSYIHCVVQIPTESIVDCGCEQLLTHQPDENDHPESTTTIPAKLKMDEVFTTDSQIYFVPAYIFSESGCSSYADMISAQKSKPRHRPPVSFISC